MKNIEEKLRTRLSGNDLVNAVDETIDMMVEHSNKVGYQCSDDGLYTYDIYIYKSTESHAAISTLSVNQQKKLFRAIKKVHRTKSIRVFNWFTRILYNTLKRYGKEHEKVKFFPPQKELDIQAKREIMKVHREAYLKALEDYKNEKGNYYKNKVS